jgi:hypothetical protein
MTSASDMRTAAENRTPGPIREAASGNGSDLHAQVSDFSAKTAEVSAQVTNEILASAREVAGTINKKLTEVTFDQTRKLLDDTTRAAVAYQEGTTGTTGGLHALIKSYTDFTLGLSQFPHTYFETVTRAAGRDGRRKPLEVLQCRTPSDFAELQVSLFRDAMTDAIEVSVAMLQVMGHVTEDAMKPLQKTV